MASLLCISGGGSVRNDDEVVCVCGTIDLYSINIGCLEPD